jgi:myo-inositol-1(or 4)-monophosphatase
MSQKQDLSELDNKASDSLITLLRSTRKLFLSISTAERLNQAPLGEAPYTKADTIIADYITEHLMNLFPDDTIIAEDGAGHKVSGSLATWVLDPIDGTIPFMADIPSYMVSLHRIVDNRVTYAIAYNPVQDLIFLGLPKKRSTCNNEPIQVSEKSDLPGARIAISEHALAVMPSLYRILKDQGVYVLVQEGLVFRGMLVARGLIEATIQPTFKQFESGTIMTVVQQAGGIVRDFNNQQPRLLTTNKNVIVSNTALYPVLHELMSKVEKNNVSI